MEESGSSVHDKGAIPKIRKETSILPDVKGYPLEPKPGNACIPQQSQNVGRTRSLTSINSHKSVRLDVLYKNEPFTVSNDSSMQVIFIKSKSKSEHTKQ